jgi:hypothetical protein
MSKKKIIPAHFLLAFSGNLQRLEYADDVEQVQFDLEDLNVLDSEAPIRFKDLPKQIPEAIRKQLAEKSHDLQAMAQELEMMISELYEAAENVAELKYRALEAAKPKCKECGQVMPKKPKRKRSK